MASRIVWTTEDSRKVAAGSVRKYEGATARSMGSDPAWAAFPVRATDHATAHASYGAARDRLLSSYRRGH